MIGSSQVSPEKLTDAKQASDFLIVLVQENRRYPREKHECCVATRIDQFQMFYD